MRRALITGVKGFCARHLAMRLAELGVIVIGVDCGPDAPHDVPMEEYVVADVRDRDSMASVLERRAVDAVFHLAGIVTGSPADIYDTNAVGTFRLLEAICKAAPTARVLLVGSAAEYGPLSELEMPVSEEHCCRPTSAYGISKLAGTLAGLDYARRRVLQVVVARPFNIVGAGIPANMVVGAVLRRIKKALVVGESKITIGNMDTRRDFVAVDDVVTAYIRMIESDCWGEVYNICSGTPRTIRSVVERLLVLSPREIHLEIDPSLVRESDVPVVYGRWEKASRRFGFSPVTEFDDAIRSAWSFEMESRR
jgi:GDP-4-dehydro-6-deoxy-D-mannose reductase